MKVGWVDCPGHETMTFLSQAEDPDGSQFHLKQARQRIHSYLEHFISVNHLGSSNTASTSAGSSADGSTITTAGSDCSDTIDAALASEHPSATDWNTFVTSLRKHCSESGKLDANGRYFN